MGCRKIDGWLSDRLVSRVKHHHPFVQVERYASEQVIAIAGNRR